MAARFVVLCIDRPLASGGVAVLYDAVRFLTEAGHEALLVHGTPGFRHMNGDASVVVGHSNRIALAENQLWRPASLRQKLRKWRVGQARPADSFALRPDDIIVVPELMLNPALIAFPAHRKVVFSQNPYLYLNAVHGARRLGRDPVAEVVLNLGISRNCMAAFEAVGVARAAYFPVAPRLDLFPFRDAKSPLIAYMPRKRPAEAEVLADALRRRGRLRGFDLCAIDGMSPEDVARRIADTQIFVSLLKDEALGFPAAEAMAAGCVVVGYTGHGTEEYFDTDTGVPVRDGDILGLIEAVEETVARLHSDPAPLDALRRRASARIHATYAPQAFRDGMLAALGPLAA
jgi:hypothetical protein